MTAAEKKQSSSVFIEAGKTAFSMLIPLQNNPYREEPYRRLWEKGHRAASRKFDKTRHYKTRG